ncbi:MAG: hypothetical protein NAG76_07480 [Candidatus Pristimantibacillus lignocellulolyticus]|uniref:NADH:quinone oxidoreductase/Mrp antiporter transmembrane domain-containing protein n=1 Tax=Candidatus Pristimantibacillus lignocellulolyticus TaxID=2994561 RepID=A0A9J6ZJ41_9BACL|nr:MAG: hypothetical protein NAG76_07480 [Candidatus Pristimantibacillus lignocellulolyticus]
MLLRRCSLRIIRLTAISILSLPIIIILLLIYEISRNHSLELFTMSLDSLSILPNKQTSILVQLALGIDAVTLWMMLLATIIIMLTALAGVYVKKRQKLFYGLIMLSESVVYILFMARDGMLLISTIAIFAMIMFFFIGIWGQEGSSIVARKFATWQLVACVLLMISCLLLTTLQHNDSNMEYQLSLTNEASYIIQEQLLDEQPEQELIRQAAFVLFIIALICMIPMIGVHHWFIELFQKSHIIVLMLYCGTLSISGWYVLYRIGSIYFLDLLASLSEGLLWVLAIQFLFASMLLWKQQHLRGWLAYGAWGQLSLIGILMLTLSEQGLTISLVHLLSFMAISALLCFLIAAIIERTGTDYIPVLNGTLRNLPFLGGSIVVAMFAWLGIPGFSHFFGTVHAVILTFSTSRWISVLIALGVISIMLFAVQMLYKLQRGKTDEAYQQLKDMRFTEAIPNIVLLSVIILLGCYPIVIVDMIELELHTVYSMWKPIIDEVPWDIGSIASIWTRAGETFNVVIVFSLLMMFAIGIASRKHHRISVILYWQSLFQLLAFVVIIASEFKTGNTIYWLDLVRYVVVYTVLLIATIIAVRSFSQPLKDHTISSWNGLYYRNPRFALLMLLLIVSWMALPFTSAFQVKFTAINHWLAQEEYGLLTIWIVAHLLMMKVWLEWLCALYIVSDTKQASARMKLHSNGTTTLISRNNSIILLCCCIVLIALCFA